MIKFKIHALECTRTRHFYVNKKAQLPLTNPRDACEKFHGLRKGSGVVSCIARLPIDSVPMVYYYALVTVSVKCVALEILAF